MKNIIVAPSILSADFKRLEQQVRAVIKAGADWLHLDVMDGHFVPNISFGPMVVKAVRSMTRLTLDTHLMIEKPEKFLGAFKNAGTDRISVHVETCPHLHRTIHQIKELGLKAGVTLNPSTPAFTLQEILPYVDLVLVMTVNPGFGGQKFIVSMLDKVREVPDMIDRTNPKILLEVDGGVSAQNAADLVRAGANVLVAGNSIFGSKNIGKSLKDIRNKAISA